MQELPKVSVICLCYNHVNFVQDALDSVFSLHYSNLEIIIVDDHSTDGSVGKIQKYLDTYNLSNKVRFIELPENQGNCKAFNIGLSHAHGKYVIDFATDDILSPYSIVEWVSFFEAKEGETEGKTGLIYCNTSYFNKKKDLESADSTSNHHFGPATKWIPHSGDVYATLIQEYFVPTPGIMYKKSVLDELGGFDETLAYEDFDILVRTARQYEIHYLDKVLVFVRKAQNSLSSGWYKNGDPQVHSTFLVCKKIRKMNRTQMENQALINRLKFQLRMCFLNALKDEFRLFYGLLKEVNGNSILYQLLALLSPIGIRFRKGR